MKDSTLKTLKFLASPLGKADYKSRLEQLRSYEDRNEPYWDRLPGIALEDIHRALGGGEISQDGAMDPFLVCLESTTPDGDEMYTHKLPGIIARTKSLAKLTEELAEILDDDNY